MNCTQFFSFKLRCWPKGCRHCEEGLPSGPTLGPSCVTHMGVKSSVAPACSQGQPGVTIVSAAEIANDSRHTERGSQHTAGWAQAPSTGDPAPLPSLLPAARGSPHSRHTPACPRAFARPSPALSWLLLHVLGVGVPEAPFLGTSIQTLQAYPTSPHEDRLWEDKGVRCLCSPRTREQSLASSDTP